MEPPYSVDPVLWYLAMHVLGTAQHWTCKKAREDPRIHSPIPAIHMKLTNISPYSKGKCSGSESRSVPCVEVGKVCNQGPLSLRTVASKRAVDTWSAS